MRRYEEMKALREQGMTHQQIADACGALVRYVSRLLAEYDPRHFQAFSKSRCIYVNLRKWLNSNKVSISELARRTGRVPYAGTVLRICERLKGEIKWSDREIERFCDVTGLTAEKLLEVG